MYVLFYSLARATPQSRRMHQFDHSKHSWQYRCHENSQNRDDACITDSSQMIIYDKPFPALKHAKIFVSGLNSDHMVALIMFSYHAVLLPSISIF